MKHTSTKRGAGKSAAPKLSNPKHTERLLNLLDTNQSDHLVEETDVLINESGTNRSTREMYELQLRPALLAVERGRGNDHARAAYATLQTILTRAAAGEPLAEIERSINPGPQPDARPLDELKARAEAIARDPARFDADTRFLVDLTLRNLRDGLKPAKDEQTLREQIGRAERGESLSDLSGIKPEAVEAARHFIAAYTSNGMPDELRNNLTGLIGFLADSTGAHIYRYPIGAGFEWGDYSLSILARVFAGQPALPRFVPELDLAGHIAAVLTHKDTPVDLHNAMRERLCDLTSAQAVNESPDVIRVALEVHKREGDTE